MQTGASKARLKYHYPIYTETPLIIPQGKFARCHHCGGNVFTTMLPDNMGGWESRCIQCGRAYNSEGDEVANYKIRYDNYPVREKGGIRKWQGRLGDLWGCGEYFLFSALRVIFCSFLNIGEILRWGM